MKTTFDLDHSLLREVRKRAAQAGVSMKAFIEDALRARLTPVPRKTKRFRLDLPVVDGNAPPRIDITDRRALYDFIEGR